VDLDLDNVEIGVINTSGKTLEAMLKTYKCCKKSKTQGGTKLKEMM
jgi:hypothetical protein